MQNPRDLAILKGMLQGGVRKEVKEKHKILLASAISTERSFRDGTLRNLLDDKSSNVDHSLNDTLTKYGENASMFNISEVR